MDERNMQLRDKICHELFIWIYYGIVFSFLIKILVFNMQLTDCLVEYVIMVVTPIYYRVRAHQLEIGYEVKKTTVKERTISTLSTIAVACAVYAGIMIGKGKFFSIDMVTYFISFTAVFAGLRYFIFRYDDKRREKLENKYNDDDDE